MARILVGKAFTREDMPQMRPAAGAGDLGAAAVGVGRAAYRTCDLVVEGGPAAPRIELVLRTVERRAALAAAVEAALAVLVVFSREGSLGSLVDDDPAFVGCERFHGLCIYREENSHEGDSPCDDSFHNALSDVQQSRRARPTTAILRLARRRGQPRSAAPCPRTWPAWCAHVAAHESQQDGDRFADVGQEGEKGAPSPLSCEEASARSSCFSPMPR